MWSMFAFAGMVSVFMMASHYLEFMRHEIPWNAAEAAQNVSKLNTFAAAAYVYMRDIVVAPGANTAVSWTTIKTAKGIPAGLASADIDSTWKVVTTDNMRNFVVCAPMPLGAVSKIMRILPDNVPNKSFTVVHNGQTIEMTGFAVSNVEADLCK